MRLGYLLFRGGIAPLVAGTRYIVSVIGKVLELDLCDCGLVEVVDRELLVGMSIV